MSLPRTAKSSGSPPAGAAVPGQAERPELAEQVPDLAEGPGPGVGGYPARCRQERHPVRERLDVGPAERRRVGAVVVAGGVQAAGQRGQAGQVVADRPGGDLAAPPGEVVGGPAAGGLPQPRLPEPGEVEPSGEPERGQVPHVLAGLGLRGQERPARVPGQAAGEPVLGPVPAGDPADPGGSRPAQFPGDLPQPHRAGRRPAAGPLLQPEQDLGGCPLRQAVQADLAWFLDRGLAPLPGLLIEGRACAEIQEALPVGPAVPSPPAPARAGRHPARLGGRRRALRWRETGHGRAATARAAFAVASVERVPAAR